MAEFAGSLQLPGWRTYSQWIGHAATRPIAPRLSRGVPGRLSTAEIAKMIQQETAMLLPLSIVSRLACLSSNGLPLTGFARQVLMASAAVAACLVASASPAHGQVVMYETFRPVTSYYAAYAPMAAGYPGGYMANYSPAGNYAAVTAFSPPAATAYVASYPAAQVVNYPVTQVANYAVETVASPVGVTSYYAPAPVYASPVYASPAYASPTTTYYAPTAVAVPLYRRGLFGGLRPARTAMYIPY